MSGASDIAYAAIRKRLESGEFAPGGRLSESELSAISGVSRTPVREALRRLALEYYVRIEPNRGAFVIDWSREDILDMFEMRSMMEGLAARKAAERASTAQIEEMRAVVAELDEVVAVNAPNLNADFLRLNRAFHDKLFEASGSRRLTEIIARFVEQAVIARTAEKYSEDDIRRSNDQHRELAEAVAQGNGILAEHIMRVHILAASSRFIDGGDAP